MSEKSYRWIKVVSEDGTFYDYVPNNRQQHLTDLREGGYYATLVPASSVPPCRYRDFGVSPSHAFYVDGVHLGGTDLYLPSTEEDEAAMKKILDELMEKMEEKE